MLQAFITLRALDIIDILLVASLMYAIFINIRGTAAFNIFLAIFVFYLFYLLVRALNMSLLSTIMGQFIGVGVIVLVIVFQQEVRRFLQVLGAKYFSGWQDSIEQFLTGANKEETAVVKVKSIQKACVRMAKSQTGAIIVIKRKLSLDHIVETGDVIRADTSSRLLEALFFKGGPLHDGAVIIEGDKIIAARCVLPISDRADLPANYGMRHRAAIGISESTDAYVVVVSEETGNISVVSGGEIRYAIDPSNLLYYLENEFVIN